MRPVPLSPGPVAGKLNHLSPARQRRPAPRADPED